MKHILKPILTITLILFCTGVKAQSNSFDFTLTSNVVHTMDNDIELSSTITKSENTLEWNQIKDGVSSSYSHQISDVLGNWDDSSSEGQLTYTMTSEGYDCELTLAGQENELTATLIYYMDGTEDETYTFEINSISYN